MKTFKSKLNIFLKLLLLTTLPPLPTISGIETRAEMMSNDYQVNTLGIESVDSSSLNILNLKRVVYVGECPGTVNKTAEGYFVDYETPVKENYAVILENNARGLSPDSPLQ